ncbi:hypothetical protein MMC17_002092 [Xylographa soralifera]|nr:hypothetical protein [Xylographa soralifera]
MYSSIPFTIECDTIIPFIAAHIILGTALAYTLPLSPIRPIALLLIVFCCLVSVQSSISQSIPGAIGNDYVIGFIFHASHFLCLAKLSSPVSEHGSRDKRLEWTVNQLFEARWGISARNLPTWSKSRPIWTRIILAWKSQMDKSPSKYPQVQDKSIATATISQSRPLKNINGVPSKGNFLLERTWSLLWTVSMLYFIKSYPLNIFVDDFTHVPPGFLRRIFTVSDREMAIRIYFTVLGIAESYCTLSAAHSLASILAIVFGSSPSKWPPLFGDIKDAYTIRRYYA